MNTINDKKEKLFPHLALCRVMASVESRIAIFGPKSDFWQRNNYLLFIEKIWFSFMWICLLASITVFFCIIRKWTNWSLRSDVITQWSWCTFALWKVNISTFTTELHFSHFASKIWKVYNFPKSNFNNKIKVYPDTTNVKHIHSTLNR